MRNTIIAGNWKMHCTQAEAEDLIANLLGVVATKPNVQVIVCPPFTALAAAGESLMGTSIRLGAQDMFWKDKGAYTGQIAPAMLKEFGCRYVLVGHSERRGRFGVPEPDFTPEILAHFGDNDATVNRKLLAALSNGLTPICCVGETLSERQTGNTDSVIAVQVEGALTGVGGNAIAKVIFAYEPVWAIGTGEVCAPDEADRVCGVIRSTVGKLYGADAAEAVHIQYGGSVKPDNAQDLLSRPNIDGALVGGAALKAADFAGIIAAAP